MPDIFLQCFRQVLARAVKKAKHVCVRVLHSLNKAVSSSYHVKFCSASEVFHRKIKHIFHGTKTTVVYVNSSCMGLFVSWEKNSIRLRAV